MKLNKDYDVSFPTFYCISCGFRGEPIEKYKCPICKNGMSMHSDLLNVMAYPTLISLLPNEYKNKVEEMYNFVSDCNKYYEYIMLPKTKEDIRKFSEYIYNNMYNIKYRRLEFIRNKAHITRTHIKNIENRMEKLKKEGTEDWVCELIATYIHYLPYYRDQLDKLIYEIRHIHSNRQISINSEDMEMAKAIKFSNFLSLNKNGFCSCPFHDEKTASFKIFSNNRAKCFGCGWSGDVIEYIMHKHNLNFINSVKFLLRK